VHLGRDVDVKIPSRELLDRTTSPPVGTVAARETSLCTHDAMSMRPRTLAPVSRRQGEIELSRTARSEAMRVPVSWSYVATWP